MLAQLAIGPALIRQSVMQGNPPFPQFRTSINGGASKVALIPPYVTVGICGIKMLYATHSYFYMAIYDLEINLALSLQVFLSAFNLLINFFQLRSAGYNRL